MLHPSLPRLQGSPHSVTGSEQSVLRAGHGGTVRDVTFLQVRGGMRLGDAPQLDLCKWEY